MNISFKELKGPRSIPLIGNLHQIRTNDIHNQIGKWTEEYGPVFKLRFGPLKVVVMTDPELIQAVLRDRPEGFRRFRKIDETFSGMGMKGLFNAEGEAWYRHRNLVTKGLDVRHQKTYFRSFLISTQRLLKRWNAISDSPEPYDIQKDFLRFTVDVTSTLAFGKDLNTLEQKGELIQRHLEKIFPMLFRRIGSPFPFWKYFKTRTDREFDIALAETEKFIAEIIADGRQRLATDEQLRADPSNILEAFLVTAEEEKNISDAELKGNLLTVLIAGVDTTTFTLCWVIYHLCRYPELQDKVREEAERVLGAEDHIINYEQLNSLPVIDALIQESMRLKSVTPMLLMEANMDTTIGNYHITKGEVVLVQSRYACTHPDHFSDPLAFDIERWKKKNVDTGAKNHDTQAHIPFGSGPRFCPGRNLAQLELRIVISMLMKNFRIEFYNKEEEVKELRSFSMRPSSFNVRIIKR